MQRGTRLNPQFKNNQIMKELIDALEFNIKGIAYCKTDVGRAAFIKTARNILDQIKDKIDEMDTDLVTDQPKSHRKSGSFITF